MIKRTGVFGRRNSQTLLMRTSIIFSGLWESGKPETLFPWNEQLILFTGLNVCGLLS